MKTRLSLALIMLSISSIVFSKTVCDTLPNWQVYKGSVLLFQSNECENYKLTGIVKPYDDYNSIIIKYFTDSQSYGNQKIEIVNVDDDKIVATFTFQNQGTLEILKNEVSKLFKNVNQHLAIVYYDKYCIKGKLFDYLLLEK